MGIAPEIKPIPPRQKIANVGKYAATLYASHKSMTFDGILEWAVNFNIFGISTFPIRRFNPVTVSIWLKNTKAAAPNNAHQTIVGRWFPTFGGGLSINEGGWRWMINDIATGPGTRPLHFHLCTHFLAGIWIYSLADFPLNEWVHVVMTYSGNANASGLKMYWNGQQVPTGIVFNNWFTSALNSNAFSHLLWGTQYTVWPTGPVVPVDPPVLTWFYEGLMDESSFWRYELTPVEVAALYNGGYPVSPLHVGWKNNKPVDRYFRMGEFTDGTPWVLPGSSIGWWRGPISPPATLSNMFWNNDGATPPLRVSEDVPP
jgi:hypothetical protein